MNKKISVIMSVYKESKEELNNSIESILKQTYKNIEFIIVDNPTELWRIDFIKKIDDSRIRIFINEKNLGLSKSLNVALQLVSGDYIARMDADDIARCDRLEKQLEFIEKTNYDLCGINISYFIDGNDLRNVYFPEKSNSVKKMLFVRNCISHPAFFAMKDVFKKLKVYNNILFCEDYDFLLRASNMGILMGNVQENLLRYRISSKGISRKNVGKQELIAKYLRNYYRKNKNSAVTEEMIEDYVNSKGFKSNLKSYNYYLKIKETRSKYKERKGIKYYMYTILLVLKIKHSFREIYLKFYEKWINNLDKIS